MKKFRLFPAILLLLSAGLFSASAKQGVAVVAPASSAADGLDLHAVGGLFQQSGNLEEFEEGLNNPDNGINNLDLDGDGMVDYIRVMEESAGDAHLIVLQVPLGRHEFQDVATIEVERTRAGVYNMQVHGNEVLFGVNFYFAPLHVRIGTWPIITWIYRPVYRPYRSVFYYGYYPKWWKAYHPVPGYVYHGRVVRYRSKSFGPARTTHVKSVTKVTYHPRSSTLVKTKTTVKHSKSGTTVSRSKSAGKTTVGRGGGGKTTTVTRTAGARKTTVTRGGGGGKTTVARGGGGRKTTVTRTKPGNRK